MGPFEVVMISAVSGTEGGVSGDVFEIHESQVMEMVSPSSTMYTAPWALSVSRKSFGSRWDGVEGTGESLTGRAVGLFDGVVDILEDSTEVSFL
jgi:hypothetical protein